MMVYNFDMYLHTPNGKAATHSLSIIETYPMFNHNNDSQQSYKFEENQVETNFLPNSG